MKVITPTQFRKNIYTLLDKTLETGATIRIIRHGKVLELKAETPIDKISKLRSLKKSRSIIKGSQESIVHIDWSKEWKP